MKIILKSIKNLNVSILTETQQMQIKGGTATTTTSSGDKRTPRPGNGTTSIMDSTKK